MPESNRKKFQNLKNKIFNYFAFVELDLKEGGQTGLVIGCFGKECVVDNFLVVTLLSEEERSNLKATFRHSGTRRQDFRCLYSDVDTKLTAIVSSTLYRSYTSQTIESFPHFSDGFDSEFSAGCVIWAYNLQGRYIQRIDEVKKGKKSYVYIIHPEWEASNPDRLSEGMTFDDYPNIDLTPYEKELISSFIFDETGMIMGIGHQAEAKIVGGGVLQIKVFYYPVMFSRSTFISECNNALLSFNNNPPN